MDYALSTAAQDTDVSGRVRHFETESPNYESPAPQNHDHTIAQGYTNNQGYAPGQQHDNEQERLSSKQYNSGQGYTAGPEHGYGKANDYAYPATQVTPSSDTFGNAAAGSRSFTIFGFGTFSLPSSASLALVLSSASCGTNKASPWINGNKDGVKRYHLPPSSRSWALWESLLAYLPSQRSSRS
ncbi:hypothetical protein GGS26DRAFT_591015 [Hypomontagnella submonticulosa]|nr:hypothetical protein GGS26DRAFT_591015 [Hypomontagnella submonticulosa]